MSEHDPDHLVPREFFSEYEGRPFHNCTRCGETLADFEDGYQVGKIVKRSETILEYALCHHCHTKMMEEVSEESRQSIDKFQSDNLHEKLGRNFCAVCCIAQDEIPNQEYSLVGIFESLALIESVMICGGCTETMNELLSEKTRGVWGDFINDNFPGIPAESLPDPSKFLVH